MWVTPAKSACIICCWGMHDGTAVLGRMSAYSPACCHHPCACNNCPAGVGRQPTEGPTETRQHCPAQCAALAGGARNGATAAKRMRHMLLCPRHRPGQANQPIYGTFCCQASTARALPAISRVPHPPLPTHLRTIPRIRLALLVHSANLEGGGSTGQGKREFSCRRFAIWPATCGKETYLSNLLDRVDG